MEQVPELGGTCLAVENSEHLPTCPAGCSLHKRRFRSFKDFWGFTLTVEVSKASKFQSFKYFLGFLLTEEVRKASK